MKERWLNGVIYRKGHITMTKERTIETIHKTIYLLTTTHHETVRRMAIEKLFSFGFSKEQLWELIRQIKGDNAAWKN